MRSPLCLHGLLGASVLALLSLNVYAATENVAAVGADADMVKRGQYLATAGDCIACHSTPHGKPMAGGLALPTPIGDIIATNITPSKTHGIGNYTLEQFSNALRKGVRADGQRLYPAMPYTSYALVSDDDTKAMYAYFMNGVQAVDAAPTQSTSLPFPFNIRLSMAAWNILFLDSKPFVVDSSKSVEWNRGAYLSRGLAHCSTCHTPRNMMMAENLSKELAGGDVGVWHAPNITSDANSGIGGWSEQELVNYMQTGRATDKGQASGPMAEAVDHSLRHLTPEDLRAIAVYIQSVPAVHDAADSRPVYAWGSAKNELNTIRGMPLPKDLNQMTGPQLYDAHCATCHQASAQGSFDGGLPPLFHNTALGRSNSNNLVMVMLDGIQRQTETEEILMPGFKNALSDQQIATLGIYLIKQYGNPASTVTVDQVKTLRAGGGASNLALLAQVGIAAIAIVILAVLLLFMRRRRRNTPST
ncbi:c-type cytochrome [Herminiimonas arsenitoxidans]|uniref:c-type cytochrome n=1 Tax=Herminiimonas arsenitoxidans TaxID=1809410 RepID=UPI0009710AAA|nr:cytochrome c [Herminiimonas arsenitoxidans]